MHYYQWNIGDYASHTAHLTETEDLAYRRMLDWSYLHEKPLPLEPADVARLIRMRTQSKSIASVLQEYFNRTDDGWVSQRVIAEIAKVGVKSEKAAESAKARWSKAKDANALPPQSEGNATHNPLPITQYTIPKTQKNTVAPPDGVTALETCCQRGWTGFKAEWMQSQPTQQDKNLGAARAIFGDERNFNVKSIA